MYEQAGMCLKISSENEQKKRWRSSSGNLRHCTEEIGHTPNACEVIGGSYLYQRFGSWDRALRLAGLGKPGPAPDFRRRWIYQQEKQRQIDLHKAKKCRKQLKKQQRKEAG